MRLFEISHIFKSQKLYFIMKILMKSRKNIYRVLKKKKNRFWNKSRTKSEVWLGVPCNRYPLVDGIFPRAVRTKVIRCLQPEKLHVGSTSYTWVLGLENKEKTLMTTTTNRPIDEKMTRYYMEFPSMILKSKLLYSFYQLYCPSPSKKFLTVPERDTEDKSLDPSRRKNCSCTE